MQLVVFALLGCFVVAHSASLSDTLGVSGSLEGALEKRVAEDSSTGSLESVELSTEDAARSKRSGLEGSGGFLKGIGSAILSQVAGASSGLSSSGGGQREYESVEYGPPVYGHDDKNFDIWSFKKAILNTLFQALKAIGGGVIALKGKLIKGGGVVVSAKGRLISAKGEAISDLGRQIAASAVLTPPKQSHSYHSYEAAPIVHHHIPSPSHESYGAPPPLPSAYISHGGYSGSASSDSYGHSAYAAPSDVVFSYAYYPSYRSDGSVNYQPAIGGYHPSSYN